MKAIGRQTCTALQFSSECEAECRDQLIREHCAGDQTFCRFDIDLRRVEGNEALIYANTSPYPGTSF